MKIRIRLAKDEDKAVVRHMDQFYLYEFSRMMPERYSLGHDGLFHDDDYERYWGSSDHFPYLISHGDELSGFALVHGSGGKFNLDQFFVMTKFQGTGLSESAARMIFDLHTGQWVVQSFLRNERSERFWARVIPAYTDGKFSVGLQEPHRTHREYTFLSTRLQKA